MQQIDCQTVAEAVGPEFQHNFVTLPADGTRGGVLLAVHLDYFQIASSVCSANAITARIQSTRSPSSWWISVVYGPQTENDKMNFMQELRQLYSISSDEWLIIGDFNLIVNAQDKSNDNINQRLLGAFRSILNDLELNELPLKGRKYTWTNGRTHTKIDRAFCSNGWDLLFPNCSLQATSSLVSDHCPLILSGCTLRRPFKGFRFESFWPKLDGFKEVVSRAWNKQLRIFNPFLRLHTKLQRTAKELRTWSKSLIGNNKLLLAAARQLIWILDVVQDYRPLSADESLLHRQLKTRFLGLSAVEKLRARQASRLSSIRAAHANSKLFFLRINGRRRRNFIQHVVTPSGTVFSQVDKNLHAFNHFRNLLGVPPARENTLNWNVMGLNTLQGDLLELPFEEEEILAAINKLNAENAPGPDGFTGLFFRIAWPIVKEDVLRAFNYFYQLHDQHFRNLNSAHICLIPKNAEAVSFSDFRPISLSHSLAKIISKVLASRLAPHLDRLVSRSQSAFIRKRSIHDNFLYTQNLIRELKRVKAPTLFLKLDIAKAFDSVRWDYLLEVLQQMGFGNRWRDWVSILLRTANSAVLLNGDRGDYFQHGRGLRQGDPLSPLLFIIAIDPLQKLFSLAAEQGFLTPVHHRAARLRVSLYADDAAIFLNPNRNEVMATHQILSAFSKASGLTTNLSKCAVYPICCESSDLESIMEPFPCEVKSFPCKYLGLPLSDRSLRRVDFQPVLDKLATRLSAWKGKLLDKSGRLTLVNAVLSSIPVHFLTVFPLKKWAIKKIDKIRRSFLWRGSENANGGHCLVKWTRAARPKELGGLGILDLERFSRALRLRWLWLSWTDRSRPWIGTSPPCDKTDAALFRASTVVTIGNGLSTSFWHDSWLLGRAPMDLAPNLYPLAWRKNKNVHEDLLSLNWTRGLWRMNTVQQLEEFLVLWDLLQEFQLTDVDDSIRWKWTLDGAYTSKSAYLIQFKGSVCSFKANLIWKAHAEGKHKFFMWLLVQAKVLTADKLALRHWPCNPICVLCDQQQETALHLCLLCPFALQVWESARVWSNNLILPPVVDCLSVEDWWLTVFLGKPEEHHKTISGILMYIVWNIWKERNRRIFDGKSASPTTVFSRAKEEMALRRAACGQPLL
ncbi:hypothetical protein U9M48_016414 [Paspalum notatum var. saurae]|uniref:Reverse transcriptase domain-containing protein n=1 Tax=Paspalum notatum var. saurae TaxID=547442 RepID=A0AAQ3WMT6_PASNO